MPLTSQDCTVHVVQRMAPGGIETLVLDLVAGAPADQVFSLAGSREELLAGWPALARIQGRLTAFEAGPGLKPGLVAKLRAALVTLKPACVVLHHVGPLTYGGLAARLAGVSRIVHVEHDAWHYENPRRRLLTRIIEGAASPHHVAVSEHTAAALRQFLPKARIDVIHNGVDLGRYVPGDRSAARERLGLAQDWRVVGTAGRLVAVKAQDVLLRAVSELPDDVHLVIAGDGPERSRLEALKVELGLQARVHFLGHRDDVAALLPALDVFCLPSHQEGFPRSVVEAQAAGIPVVASDVGGLREAVCPRTGRLVPAGDERALADAIRSLLDSGSKVSPRVFVEHTLSFDRTVEAYRQLTGGRHAA